MEKISNNFQEIQEHEVHLAFSEEREVGEREVHEHALRDQEDLELIQELVQQSTGKYKTINVKKKITKLEEGLSKSLNRKEEV